MKLHTNFADRANFLASSRKCWWIIRVMLSDMLYFYFNNFPTTAHTTSQAENRQRDFLLSFEFSSPSQRQKGEFFMINQPSQTRLILFRNWHFCLLARRRKPPQLSRNHQVIIIILIVAKSKHWMWQTEDRHTFHTDWFTYTLFQSKYQFVTHRIILLCRSIKLP